MVAAINNIAMLASPLGAQTPQPPLHDIADFKAMINDAGPINNTVKSFVENAQTKLNQSDMNMGQKLKDFDANDNVLSLIESIHESSMKSVSIQLTGKIGSKVSESFEQLVKQQ